LEAIPSSLSMQYPTTRELQSILREILRRMKLEHLYLIPWDIQDGTYLDFYNGRIDPRFSATVRGKPAEWDLEFVGHSFQLPLEGHGFLSQKDPLSERYFAQDRVVSHGYKISQCKDPELMMLFHFLIPILHRRKPSYIPVKWANTVIASWSGEREINWYLNHQKWANNTQDDLASRHPFVVLVVLEYKLFMQTLKFNNPNSKIGSK